MVKRELYMSQIKSLINKDIIKVITGIRRSGKTFFLNQIIDELKNEGISEKNIFLINLESGKYKNIKTRDDLDFIIKKLLKNKNDKVYLFFDEIQNISNWEFAINSYMVDYDCDIYITGSNSNLLSGELATYIAGRYMEIKIYPFSFKEALLLNNKLTFNDFLKYGGMPFIQNLENFDKVKYLELLYDSIIIKDIINRKNIKNIDLLDRIISYLLDNIGQEFSVQNTFNVLRNEKRKVSKDIIYNYLKYLEEASLIHKVKREEIQGKGLLKFNEKYYFTDWGFNEALFRNNERYISQILENIVFMEFLRRSYHITVGKLKDGTEIDFICRKGDRKVYVQVAFILENEKTLNREFKPLLRIKDNYEKIVISTDKFNMSNNGIKHINIEDFLLGDEY